MKAPPMRVSVTALDQFQWFLRCPQEQKDFIESLVRPWAASPAMQRGTDFHDDLEDFHLGEGNMKRWIGPKTPDIKIIRCHALEVKIGRVLETEGDPVYLSGQADGLSGVTIIENKTTGSIKSDLVLFGERVGQPYLDSWQWRSYLTMDEFSGMARVRYEVFQLDRKDEITDYRYFDCWRYGNVTDEVDDFVRRYVNFLRDCEQNGLLTLGLRGPIRRTLYQQGEHDPKTVAWEKRGKRMIPIRMKTYQEMKAQSAKEKRLTIQYR